MTFQKRNCCNPASTKSLFFAVHHFGLPLWGFFCNFCENSNFLFSKKHFRSRVHLVIWQNFLSHYGKNWENDRLIWWVVHYQAWSSTGEEKLSLLCTAGVKPTLCTLHVTLLLLVGWSGISPGIPIRKQSLIILERGSWPPSIQPYFTNWHNMDRIHCYSFGQML